MFDMVLDVDHEESDAIEHSQMFLDSFADDCDGFDFPDLPFGRVYPEAPGKVEEGQHPFVGLKVVDEEVIEESEYANRF